MAKKLAGITVSSDGVVIVIISLDGSDFELVSQTTVKLQTGERWKAYRVALDQIKDRLLQENVQVACVKGSAISLGGTKMAHLEAAELRGIVIAASATVCEVRVISKAGVSRSSSRKVDEYLKDDSYWSGQGLDALKKTMREAAFMVVSEFS